MWADSGYDGAPLARYATAIAAITIEVVRRTSPHSFQVLRRRWVVERTFGWLMRWRRLVRDYERRPDSHEAMVYWATVFIMTRAGFMHPGPARAPADILTCCYRLIATGAAPAGRVRGVAVRPGGAGVRNGQPDRAGAGHRQPRAARAVMIQMHLAHPLADRRQPPALAHPATPS